MNYREEYDNAYDLIDKKHYDVCIQKAGTIFEKAFKELYQNYFVNIISIKERNKIEAIEQEIGKGSKTHLQFGFGEFVGLARRIQLFKKLKSNLKNDLEKLQLINFDGLVNYRNKITHKGYKPTREDAEIFLMNLRIFLLETGLIQPEITYKDRGLIEICDNCKKQINRTWRYCPYCGSQNDRREQDRRGKGRRQKDS